MNIYLVGLITYNKPFPSLFKGNFQINMHYLVLPWYSRRELLG